MTNICAPFLLSFQKIFVPLSRKKQTTLKTLDAYE